MQIPSQSNRQGLRSFERQGASRCLLRRGDVQRASCPDHFDVHQVHLSRLDVEADRPCTGASNRINQEELDELNYSR